MPEARQTHEPAQTRSAPSPATGRSRFSRNVINKIASLLCLIAAAALEYYLVNIPLGEVSGEFPATVRARLQAVNFDKPGLTDGGIFSFEYTPPNEAEPVLVDLYFDKAQLSPETLQSFHSLQVSAPSSAASVSYLTSTAKQGSCSTKFEITPASPPTSVQFSQTDNDALSGFRSVGVTVQGSDAEVTLTSQGAIKNVLSPCKVQVSVGDWQEVTGGFFPIKLLVPSGANFRVRWQNLGEKSNTWDNKSVALPLLQFGDSDDEFTAGALKIGNLDLKTGALTTTTFEARAERNVPLTVSSFAINRTQLEINATGKGNVLKDGSLVTRTDVLGMLNKDPLLSALFTAANVALLGWVGRSWFPSKHKKRSGN